MTSAPGGPVIAQFLHRAAAVPESVALRDGRRTFSYSQLAARVLDLALELRGRGVRRERRVGIRMRPSAELVVAHLAVHAAGGAWVPLAVDDPDERVRTLVADSEPTLLLTDDPDALPGGLGPVLAVGRDTGAYGGTNGAAGHAARAVAADVGAGDLAYVLYTSGSTGTPKGVEVEHGALAGYVSWAASAYGAGDGTVPLHSPTTADLSLTSLLAPLVAGGCVRVLAGHEGLLEPVPEPYAFVKLTPAHLTALRAAGGAAPGELTGRLVVGGEALVADVLRGWPRDVVVVNEYGPTEATVGCVAHVGTPGEPAVGAVPIGRAVAGARVRLLDGAGRPAAAGDRGEIHVGGPGVARGYLGRPGPTARSFVPDPDGPPGSRRYRTGDLAVRRADGALEFAGRRDDQLNVQGRRIEPGEIEAALLSRPDVRAAAVVAQPRQDGTRLVAFVVPADGATPSGASLRDAVAATLPPAVVPAVQVVDRLPETASGKVDRLALAGRAEPPDAAAPYRAPRTETERLVAGVWAELLGVDRVGMDDNFFELGGHSLTAVEIGGRLRAELGVRVPLGVLLGAPTVPGMCAAIEAAVDRPSDRHVPRADVVDRGPLSYAQQRLWVLAELEPDDVSYHVPVALRLHGDLDVPALRAAVDAVTARHPILRTAYPAVDASPEQVIHDGRLPLEVLDLATPDGGPDDARVRRAVAAELARPFDLTRGPVARVTVLGLAPGVHVLLLVVHHIAVDGRSTSLLVGDLAAEYARRSGGAVDGAADGPAPAPAVRYLDYAVWQRRRLTGPAAQDALARCVARLSDLPVLRLPAGARREPGRSTGGTGGAALDVELDGELLAAVRGLAAACGTTVNVVLLALFGLLLGRLTGDQEVVVGSPVTRRDSPDLESVLGCFLDMAVLRLDLGGDPPFGEYVAEVHAETGRALDDADLPFELVVDEVGAERDPGRNPLFQVSFSHERRERPPSRFGPLAAEPFGLERATAKYELTLAVSEDPDAMTWTWEYATPLLDEATVRAYHDELVRLLRRAAECPRARLGALGAPPATAVPDAAAHGPVVPVRPGAVLAAVAAAGRAEPRRVAVTAAGCSLSRHDVGVRSAALARRLLALAPSGPVGVCLPRGVDLPVAILGIWRAGLVYLPLDPELPPARLAAVAAAAGAGHVVATGATAGLLPAGTTTVSIDEDAWPGDEPRAVGAADAADLAYVMFTSGSTGAPKGVAVPHGALANLLAAFERRLGLGPDDVLVAVTTISFDISLLELLLPLACGARLVIATHDEAGDPERLGALLAEQRATALQATPTTWRLLLAHGGVPAGVTTRICGGEPMSPELADALSAPGVTVANVYGPTETTVWSAADTVAGPGAPVTIGVPIDNTGLYVLDERSGVAPVGVIGEIHVGGTGLARGYVGAPGETARRFVPDPYAGRAGARMYRTGDLGRRRADGRVECLGRVDDQLKVRGHRVEPGEVEAALRRDPAVAAAVVVPDRTGGDVRLAAYVTPAGASRPDAAALLGGLRATLPSYLVPASLTWVDDLPATPGGKLDRAALPRPGAVLAPGTAYAPPRTSEQDVMVTVWAEVLGLDPAVIGVDDDFFALGGDSVRALRVVSRARAAGIRIEPLDLFDAGTVAGLSRVAVDVRRPAARGAVTGEVEPVPPAAADDRVRTLRVHVPRARETSVVAGIRAVHARNELLTARRGPGGTIVVPERHEGPWIAVRTPSAPGDLAGEPAARVRSGPEVAAFALTADGDGWTVTAAVAAAVADPASMRLLARQLDRGCREGGDAAWPAPGSSYFHWRERLREFAGTETARAESAAWAEAALALPPVVAAPAAGAGPGAVPLAAEVAAALAGDGVTSWFGAALEDLLLGVLAVTAPDPVTAVAVVDDGRAGELPDVDVTRTVGPFEGRFPVVLRRERDLTVAVREAVRCRAAVPRHGLAFRATLAFGPDPDRRGRLERVAAASTLLTVLNVDAPPEEAPPGAGSPAAPELRCVRGRAGVEVTWTDPLAGPAETTRRGAAIAARLADLVALTGRDGSGRVPPARFPAARLTASELDRLAGEDVVDAVPLGAVQYGMVLHGLAAPGDGTYVNQTAFEVSGPLDRASVERAVALLVRRHPALRSAVRWRGVAEPHQVAVREVALPVRFEDDSRDLPGLLAADRAAGFDLERPPLFRVTVAGSGREHVVVWTTHHAVLDGWSANLLMQEFWTAYEDEQGADTATAATGTEDRLPRVPAAVPGADEFWRRQLDGLARPATLAGPDPGGTRSFAVAEGSLDAATSASVAACCRRLRVTAATLCYGAWARALAGHGVADPVLGLVLSGREYAARGAARAVGQFARTLPLRVDAGDGDEDMLRAIQARTARIARFGTSSLTDVQRLAGVPAGEDLFDSTVAVQSFPLFAGGRYGAGTLRVERVDDAGRSSYPLALEVVPEPVLGARLRYDPLRVAPDLATGLLDGFLVSAAAIAANG